MNVLKRLVCCLFTIGFVSSFIMSPMHSASAESCTGVFCEDSDVEDENPYFGVEGEEPGDNPSNGSVGQQDVDSSYSPEGQEVVSSSGSNGNGPDRLITIIQVYCMDIEGVAMQDCLEAEQSACVEPGSQWVVRARFPADDFEALDRVGQPFCSSPGDTVIDDPAAGVREAPPMPVVTLADFRRLDIAPSQIESDSGGFGLIRANTNFYATEEPQTLETMMLGQAVAIQAVPVRWTWDFGDGSEKLSNPFPGGPQREFNQETTTSHAYQDTGEFPVSLTTSYRGQFQVNGGPWIAIPGVAEVPSDPVVADIWRSKSKNVAEDCVENPQGWACGDPFIDDEG